MTRKRAAREAKVIGSTVEAREPLVNGDVFDFTIWRVGKARGYDIVKCPKCGQKGDLTVFRDGHAEVAHRRVYSTTMFLHFDEDAKDICCFSVWPPKED